MSVDVFLVSLLMDTEVATREVLRKKRVLKIFANFTGKHLCLSLFLTTKLLKYLYLYLNTYFEEHLLTSASMNINSICLLIRTISL